MIDATQLRKQVRATLGTRGEDETMPEPLLLASLCSFFGTSIKAHDMMLALRWNEARGLAEKIRNSDEERDEWKLTERGRVKEGL